MVPALILRRAIAMLRAVFLDSGTPMKLSRLQLQLGICVIAASLLACGDDEPTPPAQTNNNTVVPDMAVDMTDPDMSEPDMDEPDVEVPEGPIRVPSALTVLPPTPASCDNPGSRQRVPFIFTSTDVVPIVTGDRVSGRSLVANRTVDTGSIAFRQPRVETAAQELCTSDADCARGFHCATTGMLKQCAATTSIEMIPGSVRQDNDPGTGEKQQLVAVLIENTSMIEGRLSVDVGGLFDANGEKDLFANAARATDATRVHRESIKEFMVGLASVAKPTNTKVSVWWYAGQVPAESRPLVFPMELSDHFTNDLSIGEALIDTMPQPVPKPSNMYQSIIKVIESDLGLAKYDDHEKFLFVFTDGPNEVYDASASYAQVLDALQTKNVKLNIVQLDNKIDDSLLRDLPTYYGGNTTCQGDPQCGARACAANTDCQNYEECRPATVYAATEMDAVTQTPASYCMPRYVDGRLGPIDQFADLTCRSGGTYMYVATPDEMRDYWRVLPSTIDGQWSVEADFSRFLHADSPLGFYRLSSIALGMLGGRDLSANLSAPRDEFSLDTRPVIRYGRVRN